MPHDTMTRETRLSLLTFAFMSGVVAINLLVFQDGGRSAKVETAAIRRTGAPAPGQDSGPQASGGIAAAPPSAYMETNKDAGRAAQPIQPQPPAATAEAAEPAMGRAEMVRTMQRGLAAQSYAPGPADGHLGLLTRAAIMAFEHDNGLALTGEPSQDLMRRISARGATPPAAGKRAPSEIKNVEAATIVRTVAQALSGLGYPVQKTETAMSPQLVRAILDYEASQKMPETGRISAILVARLTGAGQAKAAAGRASSFCAVCRALDATPFWNWVPSHHAAQIRNLGQGLFAALRGAGRHGGGGAAR